MAVKSYDVIMAEIAGIRKDLKDSIVQAMEDKGVPKTAKVEYNGVEFYDEDGGTHLIVRYTSRYSENNVFINADFAPIQLLLQVYYAIVNMPPYEVYMVD